VCACVDARVVRPCISGASGRWVVAAAVHACDVAVARTHVRVTCAHMLTCARVPLPHVPHTPHHTALHNRRRSRPRLAGTRSTAQHTSTRTSGVPPRSTQTCSRTSALAGRGCSGARACARRQCMQRQQGGAHMCVAVRGASLTAHSRGCVPSLLLLLLPRAPAVLPRPRSLTARWRWTRCSTAKTRRCGGVCVCRLAGRRWICAHCSRARAVRVCACVLHVCGVAQGNDVRAAGCPAHSAVCVARALQQHARACT
jgi:hypothetical protein